MNVYFYQMKCKKNVVDKYPYLVPLISFDNVHFKFDKSLMSIEIEINFNPSAHKKLLTSCNYIYVEYLKRYYFVDDIILLTGNRINVKCSIDVLYTYKNNILSSVQFIKRNEKLYNGKYADERYPIESEKEIYVVKSPISIFGTMGSNDYCYALVTSGQFYIE